MADEAVLWRCRHCGKWSMAKRDPIAHKRWHKVEGGEPWQGWFVRCGPFDRWTARHDDPEPRAAIYGFGEAISSSEKADALAGDRYPDGAPF